jgi:hypothetical protein
LCKVTPLYFELPLANPVLWRRSMWTNSSLVQFLIYQHFIPIKGLIDHTNYKCEKQGTRSKQKHTNLWSSIPASSHSHSPSDGSWCLRRVPWT